MTSLHILRYLIHLYSDTHVDLYNSESACVKYYIVMLCPSVIRLFYSIIFFHHINYYNVKIYGNFIVIWSNRKHDVSYDASFAVTSPPLHQGIVDTCRDIQDHPVIMLISWDIASAKIK